jgi:intein-encoded DNA endonuclease-like protein
MEESGSLTASNNDTGLLRYVQDLLERFFGIETTGPHLATKRGTILTNRGKSYIRKADGYTIYVRRAGLEMFYRKIGLTIRRKKIRLENAVIRRSIST